MKLSTSDKAMTITIAPMTTKKTSFSEKSTLIFLSLIFHINNEQYEKDS
jgi:hypothetical protein